MRLDDASLEWMIKRGLLLLSLAGMLCLVGGQLWAAFDWLEAHGGGIAGWAFVVGLFIALIWMPSLFVVIFIILPVLSFGGAYLVWEWPAFTALLFAVPGVMPVLAGVVMLGILTSRDRPQRGRGTVR